MENFKNLSRGFNFSYEKELAANETIILAMPPISPNKRGVNDIGWQCDGDITIYGTLSSNPEGEDALWQKINDGNSVNKTVSAIKIENGDTDCHITVRVLMC